jgi:hypothetical protein
MATFPSKVNYATGDILTATNMNDVGGAINLLQSAQNSAGKNAIINGDFGIWQRGTTLATYGYLADRFYGDTNATVTQSRQTFTAGTAPVAGYEGSYFYRMAKSAGGTYSSLQQKIEDVRTFAGQTVTLSYWAKIDSGTLSVQTIIEQNFGSGGSATVYTYGTNQTLTTTWTRYSTTIAVPSISGKTIGTSGYLSAYPFSTSSTAAITFDIWGVQLEAASQVSNFQTATGTKQGELAACQRYLPAMTGTSLGGNILDLLGFAYSTTGSQFFVPMPVTPRVRPTGITISALSDFTLYNSGFTSGTPTAIAYNSGGQQSSITVTTTAASPTIVQNQPVKMTMTGANGYILFTGCEL